MNCTLPKEYYSKPNILGILNLKQAIKVSAYRSTVLVKYIFKLFPP